MSTTDQRYRMSATTTNCTVGNITWATYTPPSYVDYYEAMKNHQQDAIVKALDRDLYTKSKPEDNTMILYNVYMIYAEDRKKPVVKRVDGVLAKNDEDAKVKSGLMKKVDEAWDSDYLTFICERIGEVKVKPKPAEVKSV